ncbi:hypothetical protein PUN28_003802 [Cardiocondyla obscurior]|uniref:Uncharacterized protein n=1 Tax=Cardiocondyla obscurior TaxID=286306 RepID=A0AAW2GPA1_9HYME
MRLRRTKGCGTCPDNTVDAPSVMTGRCLIPEDDPDPHLGDSNLSLPSVDSRNESPEKFKNLIRTFIKDYIQNLFLFKELTAFFFVWSLGKKKERNVMVPIALTIFKDKNTMGLTALQQHVNRALNQMITSFIQRKKKNEKKEALMPKTERNSCLT